MSCLPIVTGRVCNKKFEEKDKDCMSCFDYSRCKRKFYEDKVKTMKPNKIKGKCPKGKKVKYLEVKNG